MSSLNTLSSLLRIFIPVVSFHYQPIWIKVRGASVGQKKNQNPREFDFFLGLLSFQEFFVDFNNFLFFENLRSWNVHFWGFFLKNPRLEVPICSTDLTILTGKVKFGQKLIKNCSKLTKTGILLKFHYKIVT